MVGDTRKPSAAISVPTDRQELKGKVAVVTGSSTGIGRAIALELAHAGANIVVHARQNSTAAESTAAEIRALGVSSHVLLFDLSAPPNHAALVQQAWAWQNKIDLWINNAGADVLTGDATDWTFERKLETLWQVDVCATIGLSRQIGKRMIDGAVVGAVILNMGWDQAEQGMAGDSGEMFATIKGAVMAFSKSLARSLAPHVRVNCLAPGWIKTAWGDSASDYWQERARRESLLDRWGTPDDVARAARFLVSPASQFITGQTIAINGGFNS